MNTIICMQSSVISRLNRVLDIHLTSMDMCTGIGVRSNYLTTACVTDFTTVNSVRNMFDDNTDLFDAYIAFVDLLCDQWNGPVSVRNVEVISITANIAKVALEFY